MKSVMFSSLPRNAPGHLNMMEIMMGLDEIAIDDTPFKFGSKLRSKKFINLKSVRNVIDKKDWYQVSG